MFITSLLKRLKGRLLEVVYYIESHDRVCLSFIIIKYSDIVIIIIRLIAYSTAFTGAGHTEGRMR